MMRGDLLQVLVIEQRQIGLPLDVAEVMPGTDPGTVAADLFHGVSISR